jgi:hypothetical protein
MSQRTVKTDKVTTLRDWVARWPAATNLGFDPDTREPTIYSADKNRVKESSIPWKREADMITVLSQPLRFSAETVATATKRFDTLRGQRDSMRRAAEEQVRLAEQVVLDAWRAYSAAPVTVRATLRRDILSAEKALHDAEMGIVSKDRVIHSIGEYKGIYTPPMEFARRGIALIPN